MRISLPLCEALDTSEPRDYWPALDEDHSCFVANFTTANAIVVLQVYTKMVGCRLLIKYVELEKCADNGVSPKDLVCLVGDLKLQEHTILSIVREVSA